MRARSALALVLLGLLLAACGQKGDLVRPQPKPEAASAR
jgi:predicted small lipoprotein YifL